MSLKKFSRRAFLANVATATAGVALAACAPKATPTPAPTAAPAAQATSAPAVQPTAVPPTAAPATKPTAAPTPAPAKKEPVTIRFHARVGTQGDHFIERARAFEAEHPDIKIKEELIPGEEYHQKIEVLLAGGTVADTFWTILLAGLYFRYANMGMTLPIDDLIAADKYDLSVFFPTAIEAAKFKGKMYGLPWVCHPGRVGAFFNKTMYEQAGVPLPPEDGNWDIDDLVEQAKALTKDTNGDGKIDQFGFRPGTDIWSVLVWLRSFGAEIFSEDGTKCVMDSEEGMAAFQFLYDLYHTHKVAPTPEQVVDMMFETGMVANMQSGYWGISTRARIGDRFVMSCAPLPKGPAGVLGSMYEFDPICIYSKTKYPRESFEWLKWLANQETGIRIAEVGSVPGARPDVWESPRLTKEPMHNVMKNIMYNVMPFRGPANFRGAEIEDVFNQGIGSLWLGKGTVKEVVPELTKAIQAVLDKPAD